MKSVDPVHSSLLHRIETRAARVGVIGLGYVGLPLAVTTAERGFPVTGFDVDPGKMALLDRGESYIGAVLPETLQRVTQAGKFAWTTDFSRLADCDVIVICVPTPLTRHREPDLSFIENTAEVIARHLKPRHAGGAGIDHIPRHHRRSSDADPVQKRAGGGGGVFRRLLARTGRPRQCAFPHRDHSESRRRRRSGQRAAGRGVLRGGG